MDKKRSAGVTIFAWFYLLSAFVYLLGILTMKPKLLLWQEKTKILLPDHYYMLAQSQAIVNSIAYLITGIGLFKLLSWARIFTIIVNIIYYLYGIVSYFLYIRPYVIPAFAKANKQIFPSGDIYGILCILGFLWVVFVTYFFTRTKVKEQFK